MTIDRQAQFTAETRVTTDFAWIGPANIPTISTTQAKTGTYSYNISTQKSQFGKRLVAAKTAIRMGFWQYMSSTTLDDANLYHGGQSILFPPSGANTGVNRIYLDIDISGTVYLRRPNGNVTFEDLGSFPLPAQYGSTGTWFHVGITHFVHASAGFFSVYMNGTRVFNYLGDTRPSHWNGTAQTFGSNLVYVLGPGTVNNSSVGFNGSFIDDMFIDSYEDEVDAPVPSRRWLPSFPTGVGADAGWTGVGSGTNWQNVDDNPNNGDTDYNKALAADLRDTFVYGDITMPADHRIVAVVPSPFARRLDSEILHKLSVHAYDGLIYGNSADLDLTMSYDVPVFARLLTQPDGTDWNEADFNAMQFGYRSRGTF